MVQHPEFNPQYYKKKQPKAKTVRQAGTWERHSTGRIDISMRRMPAKEQRGQVPKAKATTSPKPVSKKQT